jgi:hypothetical protein
MVATIITLESKVAVFLPVAYRQEWVEKRAEESRTREFLQNLKCHKTVIMTFNFLGIFQ